MINRYLIKIAKTIPLGDDCFKVTWGIYDNYLEEFINDWTITMGGSSKSINDLRTHRFKWLQLRIDSLNKEYNLYQKQIDSFLNT